MKQRLQRAAAGLALCALLAVGLAAPASAVAFSDVPQSHWAAGAIQSCVDLGLFQGESATRFGVGHQMTRSAFTVVLCRFFGWETAKPTQAPYPDVPLDAWYAGAVEAAVSHGALTRQSGSFRPNDPITREELAVMLVRGLGYGTMAGLVQDLPMPFTDVDTNAGYIAMAYELGIVSGTSATAFSPDKTATREQVAVMLMRLHDKLNSPAPGKVGVVKTAEGLTDLAGYEAVAVHVGRLVYTGGETRLTAAMDAEEVTAVRSAAETAGAEQLLYASGSVNCLKGGPAQTAANLAAAVEAEGWDGLFLDISQVEAYKQSKALTALVSALDAALGDKLLYVAAEAPVWQGKGCEGYDYPALAKAADRLVLRVAPYSQEVNKFPTAPQDPLEEVYYALGQLRDTVDVDKLTLWMTTTGSAWTGGKKTGTLSAAEVAALLAEEATEDYYSSRYACAYLSGQVQGKDTVVWYLDGDAARERVRLLGCFGVEQVCLSDLGSVSAEVAGALK